MTRLYQITALILIAFGGFVIYLSLELNYSDETGPGPGFFSFWLGVLLIALALVDLNGLRKPLRSTSARAIRRTPSQKEKKPGPGPVSSL
jgi:hypothetical protein